MKFLSFTIMAPIKRLLSTKNTTPSQKGYLFLQEQISVRRTSYSFVCFRFFFLFAVQRHFICEQAPIRIKAKERKSIAPGPKPDPRKRSVPCQSQLVVTRFRAPFWPAIASLWQGQNGKRTLAWIYFVGSAAVCQPSYRDFNHQYWGITAAVPN